MRCIICWYFLLSFYLFFFPFFFFTGTAKLIRQAQSREKLLEKKLEAGLTPLPEVDDILVFDFPDPGELPPPVTKEKPERVSSSCF